MLRTNFQNNLQNNLQNSLPNTNDLQNDVQQGGADLNQIYKEKRIIGGRINKSLVEFLYKGKSQTKKQNNYIRKLRSRKR